MEQINQMNQKKKKSVGKSLLFGCILFAVMITAMAQSIGFYIYYQGMMGKYKESVNSVLGTATDGIDTDDLKACIETGIKSEAYQQLQQRMNIVKQNNKIEYLYILRPLNGEARDNMQYVITGMTKEELGDTDNVSLGDYSQDDFTGDVALHYLDFMESGKDIEYYPNKTAFGYMYTGLQSIKDSNGTAFAVISVDISMNEVYRTMGNFLVIILVYTGILTLFFIMAAFVWLRKRIIRPIETVQTEVLRFVDELGRVEHPEELHIPVLDIHTEDELENLAKSFVQMAVGTKRTLLELLEVMQEKERIGAELSVATRIQADMLPCIFPAFPQRAEFDIYATMTPAKEVGGDFYDFFLQDEDHLAMVMADVSGKGVPAALFMVITKTLLKNSTQNGLSPGAVLKKVNNQLCENNEASMFVTVWIGILTISKGKMICANAGHEYPVICRKGGAYELVEDQHGFVLAVMEDMSYEEYELELHHGDHFFVYTDGVPEATNASNELFGNERMLDALNQCREQSLEELLGTVKREIDGFADGAPQFDDITMLALDYK
ncbi:MAG: PP2C family protein-serine/threonine phosphatase [Lachnospiraceae bacterium]|nr:PP2C family protein-serine/threonine phosphatase [Lachnospiraceae bacterium]